MRRKTGPANPLAGRTNRADSLAGSVLTPARNCDGCGATAGSESTRRWLEQTNRQLACRNSRLEAAVAAMSHGLLVFDSHETLAVVNDRVAEMLQLPPGSIRPCMTFRDVLVVGMEAGHFPGSAIAELLARRRALFFGQTTALLEEQRGERIISISGRRTADGGCVVILDDVTDRRRAADRIAHLARHDPLTGLSNRAEFHARLEHAVIAANRDGNFSVLCLDLDRFKMVNDTLGHPVGDELLREVARRLRAIVRETDTLARMGGDEFAILQCGSAQPQDATALAGRLVEQIGLPYVIAGHQISIGVSVGIAIVAQDGQASDILLKNADLALYRAKADGRGTWRFFEPEMDRRMQERRRLELELRRGLANHEFQLFYQPIVDAESGALNGFEALLRWSHPDRGLLPPAEFVSLAEETGLIVPLGDWALAEACVQAASWPGNVSIAVNIASVQFRPALVASVAAALARSGLAADRLELEVSESIIVKDSLSTLTILQQLRCLGVRISMDDFGTGYSSLSYLRSFPFDKIKIDRSFVTHSDADPESRAIVRAIVTLGSSLGMRTTAEGVETEEQLERLRNDGCTDLQGFLLGRPMPSTEVQQFFLARLKKPLAYAV